MRHMHSITLGDVLEIRDRIAIGNAFDYEITNGSGLLSSLATPFQGAFGHDSFPGVLDKAGALLYLLIFNHPFRDGNKRIACEVMRLFLQRNGLILTASDDDVRRFSFHILQMRLHDPRIAGWLERHTRGQSPSDNSHTE